MSVLLAPEDPNIKRAAGQSIQSKRVDLEETASQYDELFAKFKAMEAKYIKEHGDEALGSLGLPPTPVMRRRIKPTKAIETMIPKVFTEADLGGFAEKLLGEGFNVIKHGRKGKPHARRLWLTRSARADLCRHHPPSL
jgi:hypothetical protein